MEIIPAILPADFRELNDKLELIKGLSPIVQIDVCDGRFVPSMSWPYKKQDNNFDAILKEEQGMPHWEDIDFEVDLMIKDPEQHIDEWLTAGAKRIVIHLESTENMDRIITELQGLVEIGIAINIDTPVDDLAPYVNDIDFIQCMGIARIGFQGQPFDARVVEKVREIKARFPERIVSVDGGVSLETAEELRDAGVDRLIVGSALFASDNIVQAYDEFVAL